MKQLSIALLLAAWAVTASAVEGKIVAQVVKNDVEVKPGMKVLVAVDKGQLTVSASQSSVLSYRVAFQPDRKGSWLDRSKAPVQKDYDECTAAYTAEQGLKVHTAKGISAIVTVVVPARQALDAQLSAGILTIGARPGKVDAFIGDGILEYDGSGLSAGVCVTASVNAGTVSNNRDFNCASVGAVLHGHSGVINVK